MIFDSRSWIEVSYSALKHNYLRFRKLVPKATKLLVVVKSNAYGHGAIPCARYFSSLGADYLGVDCLEEAIVLRDAGISIPILVLGYTRPVDFVRAASLGIAITLTSLDQADFFQKARFKKKLLVHIKIDTGLHRQGFLESDVEHLLLIVRSSAWRQNVDLVGMYSHFASAENEKDRVYTLAQIGQFTRITDIFSSLGFTFIRHIGATSGILAYPEGYFDMVRLGIGAYGLSPSSDMDSRKLRPALSWKSFVAEVKKIPKGSFVGYDKTCRVLRTTTIAVVPVGYFHGYPWSASGRGHVLINGKRAQILGRISMDIMVVDVTGISKVNMGTEVVLVGRSGRFAVTAGEVGAWSHSFNYESVTRIHPLLERRYKK